MGRCWLIACLVTATPACLLCETASAAVLTNGNFSTPGIAPEPFANWTTEVGFDRPSDGGGFALFEDLGLNGSSQLAQTFDLPANAISISFEFNIQAVGQTNGSVPDSFQATLFNSSGVELLPSNPPLFTAFYSIDNDGTSQFFDSNFVTSTDIGGGFKRITLDVSSLPAQTLTLDFLLNGLPDDLTTSVSLDNVLLVTQSQNPVPEPASALIWSAFAIAGVLAGRRKQLLG